MLATVLLTVVFFCLATLGMAIGALRGKRLSGSCGGIAGSACRCSPAMRVACEAKHRPHEDEVPLPPPGLERLIQLGTAADDRA